MKRTAQYDPETGELLAVYPSITAAARAMYGDWHSNLAAICKVCNGKQSTACGYVWRYHRLSKGEKEHS